MGFLTISIYYSVRNVYFFYFILTYCYLLLNDSLPRQYISYSLRNKYTRFLNLLSTSGGIMTVEVKRSPAGVCWWLCVNGNLYQTFDRKHLAEHECASIKRKYGLI